MRKAPKENNKRILIEKVKKQNNKKIKRKR